MSISTSPRRSRGAWTGLVAVGGLLGGCQTYERVPLDLESHRSAIDARLDADEPIDAFMDRLTESSHATATRFDPSDGLSVAEGEVLALFYNADLRMARLGAGVALADVETAGLWEDPVFGYDAAEILSPAAPFEFGLTMHLTLPVSGRLGVARDRAEAAYEAELRRLVDAEWNTRARVRSAWAAWTVATERARLLRDVIEQIERIASITDRLESAGELTRIEARLLRAELVETRGRLTGAKFNETQTRVHLLGLLGLPPSADVDLHLSLPDGHAVAFEDELGRLIEANTALAVRRAEYRVAEEQLRLEVRKQYPDITIGTGYGNEDDDRLLLGLSIPVPILNANRAGIAEARSRRELARAAAETTLEQLSRDLAMANAALEAARSHRHAFEAHLAPMLDEQSREVERLVDLGEVDTLILLETVSRRFEAKSRLLDMRLTELNAAVERARLLGPDQPMTPAPVARADSDTPQSEGHGPSSAEEGSR